jgi:hypothetical protein
MTQINVHCRRFWAWARAKSRVTGIASQSPIFDSEWHEHVRFHRFPFSKYGVEPYGKSVSLFCDLQVDLRGVRLGAMYPRWTMTIGHTTGTASL